MVYLSLQVARAQASKQSRDYQAERREKICSFSAEASLKPAPPACKAPPNLALSSIPAVCYYESPISLSKIHEISSKVYGPNIRIKGKNINHAHEFICVLY